MDEAVEFSDDDDEISSPDVEEESPPAKAPHSKRSADLEHERVTETKPERSPPREIRRPAAPTHAREASRDEASEEEEEVY